MSLVSFVKIPKNDIEFFKRAIAESLDLINHVWPANAKSVVIKPNLCYYWDYTTGQTTDPKFIAALIDLIRGKTSENVNISIAEADASAMKCQYAFRMLGYDELARERNVRLVNLSKEPREYVDVPIGHKRFHLGVPEVLKYADLRIDVPKIKYTMEEIKITCALKNVFGCIPYYKKSRFHPWLSEAIVAANKAMHFDLCIVDGGVVSGVEPRWLGLVIASKDLVSVDCAAAHIASVNASNIRYLRLAEKEGLGSRRFMAKGESISYFKDRYPHKNVQRKLISKAYSIVKWTPLTKRLGLG